MDFYTVLKLKVCILSSVDLDQTVSVEEITAVMGKIWPKGAVLPW